MKTKRAKRKTRLKIRLIAAAAALLAAGAVLAVLVVRMAARSKETPEEEISQASVEGLLLQYMDYISEQNYGAMYAMVDVEASDGISQEEFIKRNSAIYEGIELKNLEVEILGTEEKPKTVIYRTAFDTAAGRIAFENQAHFLENEEGYRLVWRDSMIFPDLQSTDKVRVSTTPAERGEILDRKGRILAGKGTAVSVGIVPGKLENREEVLESMAGLLEMEPEDIGKKLEAQWVKEDSFVPIRTIPKVEATRLMTQDPSEEDQRERERQERLLELPGVMLSDVELRQYPFGESSAHLVGYVQGVTAEDLKEHEGEGYTAGSVIGRSGIEGLFEKELKGRDGCRIYIVDKEGREKAELASRPVQHGSSIRLTIDAGLQEALYEQFGEDKGCSAAMDPYTGQVLALLSTPSYDNNEFVIGLSQERWDTLNGDERKPLYNRFRQTWCPGSSFKPIVAAIGLESGALDPLEDYGKEGLSWQKDDSWGSYFVTTLHAYEPAVLENALIYSDNIYFAKAALRIGAEELEHSLDRLGFLEELPFEIAMARSQYSNGEHIEGEIQLADSGYGQGQILVNPLHLACLYSAFCNGGNVRAPYLTDQAKPAEEYWIPSACSEESAERVLEGLKKVVNDPDGTGYGARRQDILLAGKTGTAEIKASKEDTSGTELGWFVVLTPEKTAEQPLLLVTMVEDVKERGGSGYVVERTSRVLERWYAID